MARRIATERGSKQAADNDKLAPYPVFKNGQKALVYRPFQDSDGPNPKLLRTTVARVVYFLLAAFSSRVSSKTRERDTTSISTPCSHQTPPSAGETTSTSI